MGLGGSRERPPPPPPPQARRSAATVPLQRGKEVKEHLQDWHESQIIKLITDKKLAPRTPLTNSPLPDRETECPICFCDFEYLNGVICCKQLVCTTCYTKLRKPMDYKCICPFCEKPGFLTAFEVGGTSSTPLTSATTPSSASSTPGSASSLGSSSSTPSYRSRTAAPLHIPVSSKADRTALEREIKMSRSLDMDETFQYLGDPRGRSYSEQATTPARHSRGGGGSGSGASRVSSTGGGRAQSQQSQQEALRELSRLLGTNDSEVDRLEELMIMAAIRQSMQEAPPSSPASSPAVGGIAGGAGRAGAGASAGSGSGAGAGRPPLPVNKLAFPASTSPIPPPPAPEDPVVSSDALGSLDEAGRNGDGDANGDAGGGEDRESGATEMSEDAQMMLAISLSLNEAESSGATAVEAVAEAALSGSREGVAGSAPH